MDDLAGAPPIAPAPSSAPQTTLYAPRLGHVTIVEQLGPDTVRVRHSEVAATTVAKLSELRPG